MSERSQKWTQRKYDFTRRMIGNERQRRRLKRDGFHEIDPTECGYLCFNELRQSDNRIESVEISADGKSLFIKFAAEPKLWSINPNYGQPAPAFKLG